MALAKRYEIVVWWAAPVEIASGLARLARMRQLSSDDWAQSRQLAKDLENGWLVIQPSESLRTRATHLVATYDLRAGDALQLAAALQWCQDVPWGKDFICGDERLREAALLSGFESSRL
jgi:predicted nucleic acid-binding protein